MLNTLVSLSLVVLLGLSGSIVHCIDDHGNVGAMHSLFSDCNSHACESSVHSCNTSQCEHNRCSDQQVTPTQSHQRIRDYVLNNDIVSRSLNSTRLLCSSLLKTIISFDSPRKYLHKQHLQVLRI
ncbi:MAG: hypothetical protein GX639_05530 [Fibrobacter sp.]|nr:hypothetical protein [Fibrobacter sp.]